jgi:CRP/FNR family transcriptional regulator, anaerobic regulatory protein
MSITPSTQQRSFEHGLVSQEINIDAATDCISCLSCASYEINLCAALRKSVELDITAKPPFASVHKVPARRTICHPSEWSDLVYLVCQGWATSSIALPDGRRQILSFLLSGDMFSTASLFEATSGRLIDAVTDVTYRGYRRSELQSYLYDHPNVLETLTKSWIDEKKRSDQLAVDLGRRTADERIAGLILDLMERLSKRGVTNDHTMEFPLRQHHIADATGLTPVHVNKVLSEFRRSGLIEITNRSLKILNKSELNRVANMR